MGGNASPATSPAPIAAANASGAMVPAIARMRPARSSAACCSRGRHSLEAPSIRDPCDRARDHEQAERGEQRHRRGAVQRRRHEEHAGAFGKSGGEDQRHELRRAPCRNAFCGLQEARLAIDKQQREEQREPLRPRDAGRGGEARGNEQRGGPRFARHPRRARIAEDIERAQRTAELQRHAEEAEADECKAGEQKRTARRSTRPREDGKRDQPAAHSAADEIARRARVPAQLVPGIRSVRAVALRRVGHAGSRGFSLASQR